MPKLAIQDREMLLQSAHDALRHAYAPYSGFKVGAAILTQDNKIFTGCNVENASYGLTICAERSAIFSAVASSPGGKLGLRAVVVVNEKQVPCPPCGACRQVIAEFGAETIVLFQSEQGYQELTIADLLPSSFRLNQS
jgi:cytidine deaminase